MNTVNSHDSEDHGRDAMAHALLQAELGSLQAPPHAEERILARFVAGEGQAAAARLAEAERLANGTWLARRWPRLCAAIALLALTATFANSWFGAATKGRDELQDPRQKPPQEAPSKQIPIDNLDNLRKLLTRVQNIELEVLTLPDVSLPFRVEVGGVPVKAPAATRAGLIAELSDNARLTEPASAEWQNQLRFLLDDGTHFTMAVYPYGKRMLDGEPTAGHRLHPGGMQGDLLISREGGKPLTELLATATRVACMAHGVVRAKDDLTGEDAFPPNLEELRLFHLRDEDLGGLARFKKLRRLDCSGLRKTLTQEGLAYVSVACPNLVELSLNGMTLPDASFIQLMNLVDLERLELRGVREFTGTGFSLYAMSSIRRRAQIMHIDLRDVPTLTDEGLQAVCSRGAQELLLAGSGKNITAEGFRSVAWPYMRLLDLQGWDIPASWQPTMAILEQRPDLEIRR